MDGTKTQGLTLNARRSHKGINLSNDLLPGKGNLRGQGLHILHRFWSIVEGGTVGHTKNIALLLETQPVHA